MQLARYGHHLNWAVNGKFAINADLEPIYRCTMENQATPLVWSQYTACFDEIGSCAENPACLTAWNATMDAWNATMMQVTGAVAPMTTVNGMHAFGGISFTPMVDATTAMDANQIGGMVAAADTSGNGKVMSITSCMMKDWAALNIQDLYLPCFDIAVQCAQTADCAAASVAVASCAADKDVTMVPNAFFPNVMEPASTASHDDWCTIATCGSAEGNSLFMAVGACGMDAVNMEFKKCYDDMMSQIKMMFILVGGLSFTVGVLGFTAGWCAMCKGKKDAHAADA